MTEVLTRVEELRNDIENLHFTIRYYIGVLAELEQLGKTHTAQFRQTEKNVQTLKLNLKRLEVELEAEEATEFDAESDPYYFSDGMHW